MCPVILGLKKDGLSFIFQPIVNSVKCVCNDAFQQPLLKLMIHQMWPNRFRISRRRNPLTDQKIRCIRGSDTWLTPQACLDQRWFKSARIEVFSYLLLVPKVSSEHSFDCNETFLKNLNWNCKSLPADLFAPNYFTENQICLCWFKFKSLVFVKGNFCNQKSCLTSGIMLTAVIANYALV